MVAKSKEKEWSKFIVFDTHTHTQKWEMSKMKTISVREVNLISLENNYKTD